MAQANELRSEAFYRVRQAVHPETEQHGVQNMEPIYRKRELSEALQVSEVTLWRWVRSGQFPKPIKLGPNTIGWRQGDVTTWLESRPRN